MTDVTTERNASKWSFMEVLRAPTERQTYLNLLYLALSFPLGVIYYMIVVTGFTLGLGLAILGIGVVILVGTVIGVRRLGSLERTLANRLLGTDISEPGDVAIDESTWLATVKAHLSAASTWRALGFVLLKFWLGVLSFVLLVSILGTAVDLIGLPIDEHGVLNVEVFDWTVADTFTTSTDRLLAVPVGLFFLLVGLPVLNGFARVNAWIASSLLGPTNDQH